MLRLALAYMFRRPVQLLAVGGMAVGLLALLCVLAVMNGLIETDRNNVRGPLSDLLLIPAVEEQAPAWEPYRQAIERAEGVHACAPHLVAYAVLAHRGTARLLGRTTSADTNGVQLVGIDPELELAVSGFRASLAGARQVPVANPDLPFGEPDLDAFGARPPILIGDEQAYRLDLRAGERLRLGALPPFLPGPDEPFDAVNGSFDVAGSFASSDYDLGMDRFYLRREDLRRSLLGTLSAEFSEVLIDLEPGVEPQTAKEAILASLTDAGLPAPGGETGGSLETWEERMAVYLSAIENERRVVGLVMFFIVVVAAFGLFATLSALVREKVRDLGVLAAVGYSAWRRGGLLLLTGAVGTALGTLAGYAGAAWLTEGDRLERFLAALGIQVFSPGIYVVSGLPTLWLPDQARFFAVCAFGIGLLFTLGPAVRAALLSPVEALRYE